MHLPSSSLEQRNCSAPVTHDKRVHKDGKIWWNVHVQVPRPLMGHAERDFETNAHSCFQALGGVR